MPRKLLKQVAAATYHQVWWPSFTEPLYTLDRAPRWDDDRDAYVDPRTGVPLRTWTEAVEELDEASYVARLGTIDSREIKGVEGGTRDAERAIRYVTNCLTKDLTDPTRPRGDEARVHFDRIHAELATLPCSPTCANWLLYGVQPDGAKAGLVPGRCKGRVHQETTLGFTGRRVLISREWSGKPLTDHRADNRAWVKAILADSLGYDAQGEEPDPGDQSRRYTFERARPDDPDVPPVEHRILRAISTRVRWKSALARAHERDADQLSANQDHGPTERAA